MLTHFGGATDKYKSKKRPTFAFFLRELATGLFPISNAHSIGAHNIETTLKPRRKMQQPQHQDLDLETFFHRMGMASSLARTEGCQFTIVSDGCKTHGIKKTRKRRGLLVRHSRPVQVASPAQISEDQSKKLNRWGESSLPLTILLSWDNDKSINSSRQPCSSLSPPRSSRDRAPVCPPRQSKSSDDLCIELSVATLGQENPRRAS
mmetsp:Transcript_14488/g.34725  ORF Transcript_14488/g.34725 Transcript_14488/m.34725 type:complete len:206 (-) Transcript_14488:854-1471(-)